MQCDQNAFACKNLTFVCSMRYSGRGGAGNDMDVYVVQSLLALAGFAQSGSGPSPLRALQASSASIPNFTSAQSVSTCCPYARLCPLMPCMCNVNTFCHLVPVAVESGGNLMSRYVD